MQHNSLPACGIASALQEIIRAPSTTEDSLADVAQCAIDIVQDMQESGITNFGLQTFYELAWIILTHHGQSLDQYLSEDDSNCEICEALKTRFQNSQVVLGSSATSLVEKE